MTSRLTKWTAILMIVAMGATGCSTTGESTVAGAVLGAGLGAVIGHQSGRALEGAAIGAAIGGIAGYVVGKSRTERLASADQTARNQGYRAVEGLRADVTQASVSPTVARRGESVDLATTLALNNPDPDESINIRQRYAIYKGDELIGDIVEDDFAMAAGTHRIIRSITLKDGFPTGRYTFVTHIRAQSRNDIAEDSSETAFTVS